ncbi:MAG: class I SAM-dependent methyltransferase [Anaerolineales bacterium]
MENWDSGQAYEQFMGRWSRQMAPEFLRWLAQPVGRAWADIGCGTGALTAAILAECAPASVHGFDFAQEFVSTARQSIQDARARFERGDAVQLPAQAQTYDVTASGLAMNFVENPAAMVQEMMRVTRPGGTVAAYVWDYAEGMQMLRYFWDAAVNVNPQAAELDEAKRFPLCQPGPLKTLFAQAGLKSAVVSALEVPTRFQNFEDFWTPFLGGTGPAPTFLAAVSPTERERIRQLLVTRLAASGDEPVGLTARSWAVRGEV